MLDKTKLREHVNNIIPQIESAEGVYELFKLLNYPENVLFEVVSKRKLQDFDFKEEVNKEIKNVYTILSFGKNIPVFLFECKILKLPMIRYMAKKLSDKYIRFLLILTSNYETLTFIFPEYEKIRTGEHKIKITRLNINKKDLYWTDIETLSNLYYEGKEDSWRDVWRKWRSAFSVERVSEKFFEDYKNTFFLLRNKFDKQNFSRKQSHEFTLQFLNRIMFLYFISKKGWLNKDPKFMKWLWSKYLTARNKGEAESDSFYDKWLKQIFFKAFNNKQYDIKDLPDEVKKVLYKSPYLNGGLFTANEIDDLPVKINDSLFKRIFNDFFERYNFTIKEDMPLDEEVAVDPQMLGYVYESLANVAEEIYDRNDLGIFYTPRIEVDFMCRRSLVEYLSKNTPEIPKEYIYRFVFDENKYRFVFDENKESVEKYFDKENLWRKIEECLDNLSVVDPACGSGAFLVGMLNVLYELYKFIYRHIHRGFSDFALKEEIISRSLYGVDIMPWAAHAAELRLWLQLIVETELSQDELSKKPLLPNLNLNIRVGDSLVQEIGGLNFQLRTTSISDRLKRKLYSLKAEKERYFHNLPAKFSKKEEFLEEEARIFKEIIEDRIHSLNNDVRIFEAKITRLQSTKQFNLYGDIPEREQKKLFDERKDLENDVIRVKKQIEILKNIEKNLKDPTKKPFIWDIDYAEIFGDKGGFDIVIGNPPYVRQEKISPPNRLKAEVTAQDRKEYKDSLIESVQSCFPIIEKIDKKSDYYIYFYFHGLSILNGNGTFCFITSNSWLDVGYGKDLQEFLLKYVPIAAIYDNPKRSFKHSGINTIIALFHAPRFKIERIFGLEYQKDLHWHAIANTAKFVMFKKPFAEVISSKNLIDIENIKAELRGESIAELVNNLIHTEDYRVFPVAHGDLLEDGWEYPEDHKSERFKTGRYEGNKWGGKYLRAPDIFYKVLEKGKDKLVELGKIAKIKRGFTTGANEFFYLDKEAQNEWNIENEFLKPVVKGPKDCKTFVVDPKKLKFKVFYCNKPKSKLTGTNALKYIKWGEEQIIEVKSGADKGKKVKGYHKLETVKNRNLWYALGDQEIPLFILIKGIWDRHFVPVNKSDVLVDQQLYSAYEKKGKKLIPTIDKTVNSTLTSLFFEIEGRSNFGEGILWIAAYEARKILVLRSAADMDIELLKKLMERLSQRQVQSIFKECGINLSNPIREQDPKPLPDRAELDKIIFDELGLTEEERKEVYYSICELVKNRLDKAKSLKSD